MISFYLSTEFSIGFIIYANPFEDKFQWYLHIFNELIGLCIIYLVMAINGVVTYGPTIINVGDWIAYILYSTWTVNAFITVILICIIIQQSIKKCYKRRQTKKKAEMLKSKKQSSGGLSLFNSN